MQVRLWNGLTGKRAIVAIVPLAMWESYAGKDRWSTVAWIRTR